MNIAYTGDPANLTLDVGATLEVLDRTTRAHVHDTHWDGNVSRLSFDPGTATELELTLRPAARIPRIGRRPSHPR